MAGGSSEGRSRFAERSGRTCHTRLQLAGTASVHRTAEPLLDAVGVSHALR